MVQYFPNPQDRCLFVISHSLRASTRRMNSLLSGLSWTRPQHFKPTYPYTHPYSKWLIPIILIPWRQRYMHIMSYQKVEYCTKRSTWDGGDKQVVWCKFNSCHSLSGMSILCPYNVCATVHKGQMKSISQCVGFHNRNNPRLSAEETGWLGRGWYRYSIRRKHQAQSIRMEKMTRPGGASFTGEVLRVCVCK